MIKGRANFSNSSWAANVQCKIRAECFTWVDSSDHKAVSVTTKYMIRTQIWATHTILKRKGDVLLYRIGITIVSWTVNGCFCCDARSWLYASIRWNLTHTYNKILAISRSPMLQWWNCIVPILGEDRRAYSKGSVQIGNVEAVAIVPMHSSALHSPLLFFLCPVVPWAIVHN